MGYMQGTSVSLPPKIYEKLETEAKRHRISVSDLIQGLMEGKHTAIQGTSIHLMRDLLALSQKFHGPKDLSSTYKKVLYGDN